VATGADGVFVVRDEELPAELARFAHPTIAGRQMSPTVPIRTGSSMLIPYDAEGTLLPEHLLGALGDYLRREDRYRQLLGRTCVLRKPWYAFHENPPMRELARPKLLCKDITAAPYFVPDVEGRIVPRHSTYYIVPTDASLLGALAAHLNSAASREWLTAHCQRVANGFLRLQSNVLRQLPIPAELMPLPPAQLDLAIAARPA
jgi:hypothetical protein